MKVEDFLFQWQIGRNLGIEFSLGEFVCVCVCGPNWSRFEMDDCSDL